MDQEGRSEAIERLRLRLCDLLTVVTGNAYLLEKSHLDDRQRALVKDIVASSEEVSTIIRELLAS